MENKEASDRHETQGPTYRYVMGFVFNKSLSTVVLIRKNRPAWQAGKLNGIGGKIEPGETPIEAMCRECEEETNLKTYPGGWREFLHMSGINDDGTPFSVDCFCTAAPISFMYAKTDELLYMMPVGSITLRSDGMIDNVPWMIGAAIDVLIDDRPLFIRAEY